MSNGWMTLVKPVPASRPAFLAAAVTSNSLPKSQTPIFLPLKSAGLVTPVAFHDTDSVPERWKTWAMLTRSDAGEPSRAWRTLGTQAMVNSGPFSAEPAACGTTSGPPGTRVRSSPSAS